jgi:hypothetical protein
MCFAAELFQADMYPRRSFQDARLGRYFLRICLDISLRCVPPPCHTDHICISAAFAFGEPGFPDQSIRASWRQALLAQLEMPELGVGSVTIFSVQLCSIRQTIECAFLVLQYRGLL